MAQVKSRKYPPIECGDIYFLYRPAVGLDEAHAYKDVRRLYILLKPWGTRKYRLLIVGGKKRYSPFFGTGLDFALRRRLGVDTLILAGINTSSCVLCCGFEATNRDYRVVIASDAVDSMDGEEMHRFALRLMAATIGWPLGNREIVAALQPG